MRSAVTIFILSFLMFNQSALAEFVIQCVERDQQQERFLGEMQEGMGILFGYIKEGGIVNLDGDKVQEEAASDDIQRQQQTLLDSFVVTFNNGSPIFHWLTSTVDELGDLHIESRKEGRDCGASLEEGRYPSQSPQSEPSTIIESLWCDAGDHIFGDFSHDPLKPGRFTAHLNIFNDTNFDLLCEGFFLAKD